MSNRRSVLKTAGVLLSSGIATGSVVARDEASELSLEEAGIEDAVSTLFSQGKVEQAHNLLEQHNVRHDTGYDDTIGNGPSDPNEIGTEESQWSENNSSIYSSAVNKYGDMWLLTSTAFIEWGSSLHVRDARRVNDAMGMSWNSNYWDSSHDQTASNVNITVGGSFEDWVDAYYTGDFNSYGLGIDVDLDSGSPTGIGDNDFYIDLQTDLIRDTTDNRRGVKSHYVHTYSVTSSSMSISIGPSLWSVNVGLEAGKWEPGLEAMAHP